MGTDIPIEQLSNALQQREASLQHTVCGEKRLLRRKCATNRTRFVQYHESLRKWHDFWFLIRKFQVNAHVCLMISDELPQEAIRKSIISFRKRLRACINAKSGHFELLFPTTNNWYFF